MISVALTSVRAVMAALGVSFSVLTLAAAQTGTDYDKPIAGSPELALVLRTKDGRQFPGKLLPLILENAQP
jgi:hypothetical protein